MTTSSRPLAVVTGASSGIGYELARQFAQNGFDLVVVADESAITGAGQNLERLGADVQSVQADLARPEEVDALYERIAVLGRPVDALAINAGVGVSGAFADTPLEDELRLVDLNVRSAVHLAKRILPGMVERGQGRVLFTSSIVARQPNPFQATYAASKAFLLSLSEAIRNELKDTGVTVTALMPGPTDTKFFWRAGMEDTPVGAMSHKDDPADVAREGFEAMMAGKGHVVSGSVLNRVATAVNKVTPETVKSQVGRLIAKPGSGRDGDRHGN